MNEERNPYTYGGAPENSQPSDPQQTYSQQSYQQPVYRQQPNPQQPYQQPVYPQQPNPQQPNPQQPYQQPVYPQQPYRQPYYGYAPKSKTSGAAKAFSIISFVAGLIALFVFILTVLFNISRGIDEYSVAVMFGISMPYGLFLAVPGLIFGIIALIKKTSLFPLGLMGVLFNGMLVMEMAVTFFLTLLRV